MSVRLPTGPVALFAPSHQTYVCAEITTDPPVVVCNRGARGPWENFTLEPGEQPDTVAFRAANGRYMRALESLEVIADAERIQSWESYTRVRNEDGTSAFKTAHGKYLRAVDTGELLGDAERIGAWESFETEGWIDAIRGGGVTLLHGRMTHQGRVLVDATGPRAYAVCHFMEAFSLFTRNEGTARAQLEAVARVYPAIRVCDTLGYYDYWRGREVAPHAFTAKGGYGVPATPDYWGALVRFYQVLASLGLKAHHSRGDLQMFGSRSAIRDHIAQVCRTLRDAGLQDVVEIHEVCNEPPYNGVKTPADARYLAGAIRTETPGTLVCHGAPGNSEEPDELRAWAEGADVGSVHGLRPGPWVDVLRHIFSIRREGWGDPNQCGIQGEPFGPGSDVSGTRHDGDPLGRSDDVEFLAAAGLLSTLTAQRWCYMSGYGVRWNGDLHRQPGFGEVARAVSSLPNDVFGWDTTRGGSSNNPFRSPTGYHGDPGVSSGPARIDGAIAGDGRYGVLVYGGKAPYVVAATRALAFDIVNPATLQVEQTGTLAAGQTLTLSYRIGRLLRGTVSGGKAAPPADDEPPTTTPPRTRRAPAATKPPAKGSRPSTKKR